MKIKLVCGKDDKEKYLKQLKAGNFEIVEDDFDLILIDNNYKKESIVGRINESYELLKPEDILYIESFGHEIICTTINNVYRIKEKLYEIEAMFFKNGFIRINKSYVINKNHIKDIKPTFNSKFIITMKDNVVVEVTRSYYYKFKESIGF